MAHKAFKRYLAIIVSSGVLCMIYLTKLRLGLPAIVQRKIRNNVKNTMNSLVSNCTDEYQRTHFMTSSCLRGRTGNRLFQLATLIATAKQLCYTPVVKPGLRYLDDIFEFQNVRRKMLDETSFRTISERVPGKFDAHMTSRILPAYNWTLLGFRISFKYFENYASLIRSSFNFKTEIKKDVLNYTESFSNVEVKVCLHVRRSDMLEKLWRGFVVSSKDYINRAIVYMKNRLRAATKAFVVVSDDIDWCKENIKGFDIHYSPFVDRGRDICLLTQCDHHIITSGTFGWMGAWLNETGLVVYDKSFPKPNTEVGSHFTKDDYYPSRWIGI